MQEPLIKGDEGYFPLIIWERLNLGALNHDTIE